MTDKADCRSAEWRVGQRLVLAMLEEVHVLGHPDAGANGFLKVLIKHDREAQRIGLIFNLDFGVDPHHLNGGGSLAGGAALFGLAFLGAVDTVHATLLKMWL